MMLRKLLFRILLGALAVSAVFGVLAALTQGSTVVLRVIGTCGVTAVACALLIAASVLTDRPGGRAAGLLAHAAVGVEFVLALLVIWEVPEALFLWNIQAELALTMLTFGAASLIGIAALKQLVTPGGVWSARIAIGVDAAAFFFYMLAIWLPSPPGATEELIETGSVLLPYGLLAVLSMLGCERGLARRWRGCSLAACVASVGLCMTGIWTHAASPAGAVALSGLSAAAAALALSNVLLLCALTPGQRWLRGATIAAAIATAALFTAIAIRENYFEGADDFGPFERLAAAGSILTGCGALAVLVLARLNRRVAPPPVSKELSTVSLTCPRCSLAQIVPLGRSSCSRCGLRISVGVEEPRCPQCDYHLYGSIRRCPECGTEIPEDAAAPSAATPLAAPLAASTF